MKFRYPNLPGIYKFTNKINGKVYIGKSVCLSKRLRSYKRDAKNPKITRCFICKLRKYGIDNFKLDILELFPKRNAFIENYILEREEFWIKFYNCTNPSIGYNLYSKDPLSGYERIESSIKKQRESKMGNKNPMFNVPHSGRIKICRVDKTTFKTLKTYDMLMDVTKDSASFSICKVSLVINNKRKTHAGFLWEKLIENELESDTIARRKAFFLKKKDIKPYTNERRLKMSLSRIGKPLLNLRKKIGQIDPNSGEEVRVWSSVAEAESFYNPKSSKSYRIRNHVYGHTKLAYGYIWKYK